MNDSSEYILKIFQNIISVLCHDIINPVNSILICNDPAIPKNDKITIIINDSINKILNFINVARYLYSLESNDVMIPISQINHDWRKILIHFELNFDEKIGELPQNLIQILFHVLHFAHDFFDSRERVVIMNGKNQLQIIFDNEFEDGLRDEMNLLIDGVPTSEAVTHVNCHIHFFHFIIEKNNMKIFFNSKNQIKINF